MNERRSLNFGFSLAPVCWSLKRGCILPKPFSLALLTFAVLIEVAAADSQRLRYDVIAQQKHTDTIDKLVHKAEIAFKKCDITLEVNVTTLDVNDGSDFDLVEDGPGLRFRYQWLTDFLSLNSERFVRKNNGSPLVVFIDKVEADPKTYTIGLAHPIRVLRDETGGWITQEQTEVLKNVIFINARYLKKKNQMVLAHELGHLLGLGHTRYDDGNIMSGYVSRPKQDFNYWDCKSMRERVSNEIVVYP